MPREAKYLIDDAKFHIAGIATSWDYDNRITADAKDVFAETLVDDGSGYGLSFKREFQPQTDGKLVLELYAWIEETGDGVRISVLSSDGEELFAVTTEDGFYRFGGCSTDIASAVGSMRIRAAFDLDAHTAQFAVNGVSAGEYTIAAAADASVLRIGTTGKTQIRLTPRKIRLYADYLVNESFLYTDCRMQSEWATEGQITLSTHDPANVRMDYTYAQLQGDGYAALPFAPTDADIIAEAYILLTDGSDGATVALTAGGEDAFGVVTKDHAFYSRDGEFLRRFTPNVWQVIRFETTGDSVRIRIDGKDVGTFRWEKRTLDGIAIRFASGTDAVLRFTDLYVKEHVDYPDYCPEPVPVRHPEYEVGVNVCNMWREGHHFGWDRITYFTDNTPLIGPYDEGSPEVADWEIRFMVEHGITFQHFCWYCPDPKINSPLRRSRMDEALRDGFMNARYSDKMKFIIMWENATYSNDNPEDFKNYIWKYWCEYFFTDPRYLKIGNKPLISLWAVSFIQHWGGPEKAKEIIAFMNEDIKNYGCDGILLMGSMLGSGEVRYSQLSEYCDITYSYHFDKAGYDPDYQIESIDRMIGYGMAPYMQTVSVGFNNCPWGGGNVRSPMITLDGYEKVLRHVKDRADNRTDEAWHKKFFMMSTWNEYGEGTYIMPSHLYGFGYLDKIRQVFVPEAGACDNLLPDENQQKRITTLRKPGRVMIRRLGYEPTEEEKAPDVVVKSLDLTAEDTPHTWVKAHGVVDVRYTAEGVLTEPVGRHEHYSLLGHADSLIRAEEADYIRLKIRSREGDSRIRLAFLTDTDNRWASNKCETTVIVPKSEEFSTICYRVGRFSTWAGTITDIRIDNMTRLPFEIAAVDFMVFRDGEHLHPRYFVNGQLQHLAFEPTVGADGAFSVSLDPGYGAFRALRLYHEYDASRRTLTIASRDTEVRVQIDAWTAKVNQKTVTLASPVRMRDGLPTADMRMLCGWFGFSWKYDPAENAFYVTV